jgi:hypothetical protein
VKTRKFNRKFAAIASNRQCLRGRNARNRATLLYTFKLTNSLQVESDDEKSWNCIIASVYAVKTHNHVTLKFSAFQHTENGLYRVENNRCTCVSTLQAKCVSSSVYAVFSILRNFGLRVISKMSDGKRHRKSRNQGEPNTGNTLRLLTWGERMVTRLAQ